MNPAALNKEEDLSQQAPGVQLLVLKQPFQAPFPSAACNEAVPMLILLKLLVAV